jgi:hypothetical protein
LYTFIAVSVKKVITMIHLKPIVCMVTEPEQLEMLCQPKCPFSPVTGSNSPLCMAALPSPFGRELKYG